MKKIDNLNPTLEIGNIELKLDELVSAGKHIGYSYVGNTQLDGKKIKIVLDVEENIMDVIENYKKCCMDFFNEFHKKYIQILKTCAKDLCFDINDWNQELDHEITEQEFIERISKSDLEISIAYGKLNVVILDADGLTLGEEIIYIEDLETKEVRVELG